MYTVIGKCDICGKDNILIDETAFYYPIGCECCNSSIDDKDAHLEVIRHCENCIPDIPKVIKPVLSSRMGTNVKAEVSGMVPYHIVGEFCIGSEKFKNE